MNKKLYILIASLLFIFSCTEEIDKSNRYVFTGETIGDYIKNRADQYSNMLYLVERADMMGLLETYGRYTFFIPTNEGIERFFFKQDSIYHATKNTDKPIWTGITSPYLEDVTDSMAQVIVRTHIIEECYRSVDFSEGAIPTKNFSDRLLSVNYKVVGDNYFILINNCAILIKDEMLENGIIHVLEDAINPSSKMLPGLIDEYKYFSLFSAALRITGIEDSLLSYSDEAYNSKAEILQKQAYDPYQANVMVFPLKKYIKYTGFIETDDVFAQNGINTIDDLKLFAEKWYGSEDRDNPKSPKNALHKFVAYHFTVGEYPYNKMVFHNIIWRDGDKDDLHFAGTDRFDYFEMQNQKLCKVIKPLSSKDYYKTQNIYLNYSGRSVPYNIDMNRFINVRIIPPTEFVKMKEEYAAFDPNALNGIIHPIDRILVYNEDEMKGNILNERMRFEITSLLPELASNGYRHRLYKSYAEEYLFIPQEYCKNIKYKGSIASLISMFTGRVNGYMGKQTMLFGYNFDLELRLPRVIPGTYEIRIGYGTGEKAIVQFYLDGKITGLPLDASIYAHDPRIGHVRDINTDDNGYENDRQMRLRGYMKAPDSYKAWVYLTVLSPSPDARNSELYLRKIITTAYLDNNEHWLRIKLVDDIYGCFSFDFIEIVPLSIISDPMKPEDRG